jgi:hypothetical protein
MSAISKPRMLTSKEYLTKAYQQYIQLEPYFTADDGYQYWPCGCILNSIIDFLSLAAPAGIVTYEDARAFLNKTAAFYLDNHKQGVWYDDWCWWGISTAKIFDPKYDALFEPDKKLSENFYKICTQTFRFMQSGDAPYSPSAPFYKGTMQAYNFVVEQAKGYPDWEDLRRAIEPVWNLGCWQGPMAPASVNNSNYDPLTNTLGSFQDSVMNGLVYIFVQRTLNKTGADGFELGTSADVENMTSFYKNWMSSAVPAEKRIFNVLGSNHGLFRERIGMYKDGTTLMGFRQELAWAGDQGLMLGALTQLYNRQTGSEQSGTLRLIESVVRGVLGAGLGAMGSYDNVIMPWCNIGLSQTEQPGNAPGYDASHSGDNGDYFSGTGIFMRGLLEAMSNQQVKDIVVSNINVLSSTIDALDDGTQYVDKVFTNGSQNGATPMFDQFNKMATYLVASQVV